jgi:hypothetical protein
MADDERNRLRSAHVDEYRARMDALIDESIVRPRFEEANAAWRDHVERNVRPSAAAVRKQAAALTAADPRAAQIAPTVDKAVAAAEAIRFAPPPGNTWWQTVNAKMEAIAEIADNAAEKMVAGRHTADLTADLEADAARAEHDAEALVAALAAKKKELEDQAKNAFASLSMLAKPLEFIAVEAETVVRWYPLVIGIALAIAAWFGTEARRGYLAALAFVEHAMPEDAAWKRVVERSRASLRPTRSPWIPWLAAAVVWCGAAAWRLVSLDSQTMARAPGAAAAGVALVAAAVAHRVWTERRAERGGVTAT